MHVTPVMPRQALTLIDVQYFHLNNFVVPMIGLRVTRVSTAFFAVTIYTPEPPSIVS